MRLLIGTNNAGKVIEIGEALAGFPIDIVTPKILGIDEAPPETGVTFEENAILKARFFHERSGLPTVADDSGIIVEAIQDELGLHTRRWGAGPDATDQEWIEYFLDRMKKEKNKRARFVCVLAFIDQEGKLKTFEGDCDGVITDTLEAKYLHGLPISSCFKPDGYDRVFSALNIEQKNGTSHRGRAAKKFAEYLKGALEKMSDNHTQTKPAQDSSCGGLQNIQASRSVIECIPRTKNCALVQNRWDQSLPSCSCQ